MVSNGSFCSEFTKVRKFRTLLGTSAPRRFRTSCGTTAQPTNKKDVILNLLLGLFFGGLCGG